MVITSQIPQSIRQIFHNALFSLQKCAHICGIWDWRFVGFLQPVICHTNCYIMQKLYHMVDTNALSIHRAQRVVKSLVSLLVVVSSSHSDNVLCIYEQGYESDPSYYTMYFVGVFSVVW